MFQAFIKEYGLLIITAIGVLYSVVKWFYDNPTIKKIILIYEENENTKKIESGINAPKKYRDI